MVEHKLTLYCKPTIRDLLIVYAEDDAKEHCKHEILINLMMLLVDIGVFFFCIWISRFANFGNVVIDHYGFDNFDKILAVGSVMLTYIMAFGCGLKRILMIVWYTVTLIASKIYKLTSLGF